MSTPTTPDLGIPFPSREGYRPDVEFRLLGSVEVFEQGNGSITLGGPKQRAVLAHLLLRANNLVPTEVLIDEVWGDEPPEAARNALQAYASHLRKAVGPERLEGSRAGYVLRADPSEVDTYRFQSLLRDAQRLMPIDPKAAVAVFDQALSLWRGPAFGDLAPEPSLRAEAARLDELRMGAIEDRIEALLTLGVHGEVIGELEGLVARHPMRERLWGQLILALYRSGRQAEALGAYQRAREILADELGIDPSPELRRLHERILQQSPDLEVGGAPLRGYRLLERVGAGSFGTVWRAVQPDVGRDVAVKAIHPHLANEPDFIRNFETEAQLIARLEHPHIVPLYDFWREPGGAYLVMRYLRGGSLAETIEEAPFEIPRAARVIEQVSDALAAAHRQGVVHRDVKPGNILLDDEGNAYLADFGIAKDLLAPQMTQPGAIMGSPLYLAPEQIRGGAITPRTDVYALGIVLYEMLVGEHPFANVPDLQIYERQLEEPLPSAHATRTDLPPAVHGVIAAATAKDPDLRFPDAATFGTAVHDALAPGHSPVTVPVSVEVRNPYKGLRPFDEADALDFYGREAFVERLLQRWERVDASSARLIGVVGPSGSGKSSIVRAGLVPALRRGAIEGSEKWFISEMVPGRHPMENLEAALLRVAARPPAGLLQVLESGPRGLLRAVEGVVPEGSELILVIDQFEEVFTLTENESERSLFLESLRVATAEPSSQTRVVVTLRADFYDRPLNYPRFGPALGASSEVVTPLAPDELERAIVRPAGSVGLRVEPALVAQVASEVADQPGALPLVQYALTELFEQRDEGALTLAAYRDIGGVGGALAARGEQLYAARDAVGREAVRQLFLRLVTLGEGAADTRRRVLRSEVSGLDVAPEAMESALDAFGRYRLLTFDRDPATREPTVEVAHEALLRSWPRLRGWIDGGREDVRMLRRLADASTEWERNEREPSYLLRGSRLDQFETWVEGTDLAVRRAELGYLRASVAAREEERAAETGRRDHERALERRSVKRLRGLVAVLAAAALVAASLTVIARRQSDRAGRESRIATARELAAAAVANLEVDAERAVLLAMEAMETTRSVDGSVLPVAEEALHRAVVASRIVLSVPGVGGSLDWSPRGVFVTEGPENSGLIDIRDTTTGESVLSFHGHDIDVNDVAFNTDGSMLATTGDDGSLKVWDPATGDSVWTFASSGDVWGPSFTYDGSLIAAAWGAEGITRVLDTTSGRVLRTLKPAAGDTAFSPDGRMLAVAPSWNFWGDVLVFDLGTGKVAFRLKGFAGRVAWSPDGQRIATNNGDGSVQVWDGTTGELLFSVFGHPAPVFGVDWSPDGTRLVTAGDDGRTKIWELTEHGARERISLSAQETTGGVYAAVFSPDGEQVMTSDGSVTSTEIWDVGIGGDAELMNLPAQRGDDAHWAGDVRFFPDGRRLASTRRDGGIAIWDTETGRNLRTIPVGGARISAFDLSADGTAIAAALEDGLATGWDVATGKELFSVNHHEEVVDVDWSEDGEHLVTATNSGSIRILDAAGRLVRRLGEEGNAYVSSARFSPDGRFVVTSVEPRRFESFHQTIWDWERGEIADSIQPGDASNAARVTVYDPTGSRLATSGGYPGVPSIWDVETGKNVVTLPTHSGGPWDIAFSPDGSRVATAGTDGTVRLFDAASGDELLSLPGHQQNVARLAFSPDGSMLASKGLDGTVRIWALDLDDLLEIAQQQVTRSLTDVECRQYLHLETCV